jgi:hypothetical protein
VAASSSTSREHPNPDFSYENQRDAPYHAFLLNVPIEARREARESRSVVEWASRDVVNAELGRGSADLRAEGQARVLRLLAADRRAEFARELSVVAARARRGAGARRLGRCPAPGSRAGGTGPRAS